MSSNRLSIAGLVIVPGLITLAVTILRLAGELQHWSKTWFNATPGGAGAIIGIVWLAPIFGIYFARKLVCAGDGPSSAGKAIGLSVLGFIVLAGGIVLSGTARFKNVPMILGGLALIVAAAAIEFTAWPSLGKALAVYGYLARIPVAIIMYFALSGHWGTHYDGLPPGYTQTSFAQTYVFMALIPQLIAWVAFTIVIGSLFGSIAAALMHKGKVAAQAM